MTCAVCGESYPKGSKRKFVNYCCSEQAHAQFEKSVTSLRNCLEDLAAIQELDDLLKGEGIAPIEDADGE